MAPADDAMLRDAGPERRAHPDRRPASVRKLDAGAGARSACTSCTTKQADPEGWPWEARSLTCRARPRSWSRGAVNQRPTGGVPRGAARSTARPEAPVSLVLVAGRRGSAPRPQVVHAPAVCAGARECEGVFMEAAQGPIAQSRSSARGRRRLELVQAAGGAAARQRTCTQPRGSTARGT
jgi:hypothetical protein